VGSEEVELPDGSRDRAWLVERPTSQPENARTHPFHIIDRPPYLVSRNLIDLESGETSFHVSLIEWQPLGS
jgi:hypothetical protein